MRETRRSRREFLLTSCAAAVVSTTPLAACHPQPGPRPKDVKSSVVVLHSLRTELSTGPRPELVEALILRSLSREAQLAVLNPEEFAAYFRGESVVPEVEIETRLQPGAAGYILKLDLTHRDPQGALDLVSYDLPFSAPDELLDGRLYKAAERVNELVADSEAASIGHFTRSWPAYVAYFEGRQAWAKMTTSVARERLEQALKADEDFDVARIQLAGVLHTLGDMGGAKKLLDRVREQLERLCPLDQLDFRAAVASLAGDKQAVKQIRLEMLRARPMQIESYYAVGDCCYSLGEMEEAIGYYERCLELDPKHEGAHNYMGYCLSAMGRHEKAIDYLLRGTKLSDAPNAYDSLGDAYSSAGRMKEAQAAKEQALQRDPSVHYFYAYYSYILVRQGKLNAAEKQIDKYLTLVRSKDNQTEGFFRRAFFDYVRRDYAAALAHCEEAVAIFDSSDLVARNHKLHWMLGLCSLRTGDVERARNELAAAQQLIDEHQLSPQNYRANIVKNTLHLRACLAAHDKDLDTLRATVKLFDDPKGLKYKIHDNGSNFDLAFFNAEFGLLFSELNVQGATSAQEAHQRFARSLEYNPSFWLAHYGRWRQLDAEGATEKASAARQEFAKSWAEADSEIKTVYGLQ